MENPVIESQKHIGNNINSVRRLRGMSQTELGNLLGGITKQAVSKLEQSKKLDDKKIEQIATALGVTPEGLKHFNSESVLYNTYNFYENCGVKAASIGAHNIETINNMPLEETIAYFEKLLKAEKEKFEKAKNEK